MSRGGGHPSSEHPLTTGQVAEYCHVSQATIVNWIKDRKLSGYTTPGGHYRIRRSDLVSFLRSHDMPVDATLNWPSHKRLLVLSDNPMVQDAAKEIGNNDDVEVLSVANDYATSAEAVRSKPDVVIIDVKASSDPLSLCEWLSEAVEEAALLVIGDGRGKVSARTPGVDVYLPLSRGAGADSQANGGEELDPDFLSSLGARLKELLR